MYVLFSCIGINIDHKLNCSDNGIKQIYYDIQHEHILF